MPFVTLAAPVAFLIAVAISNKRDERTKPITGFIALQSAWMTGFWLYQLAFLVKDGHGGSPIIILFALIANGALNYIFYEFVKARLLEGKDREFHEYSLTFKRTQRCILVWSMLTSFQLFRFQYCGMCGKARYLARFENRMKYYKRVTRYTLFQLTFVYLPTIAASLFNLAYTWPGRQVFWIDLECILMGAAMGALHVVVMLRTQKEYIKHEFDVRQFDKPATRSKYLVEPVSKELGNEIATEGFKRTAHQKKLAGMSNQQRAGTLRVIFDRMFAK